MKHVRVLCAAMAALGSPPRSGEADTALTFEQALARARETAPPLAVARANLAEAQGRLSGATPPLRENPRVEVARGDRSGAESADIELALSQPLEIAGERGLRVSAARAGAERAEAAWREAVRGVLRDVGVAFYRSLHAEERLKMAKASEEMSAQLLTIAERRYGAGDIAALELNLAKAAAGRDRAAVFAAEAARELALADLAVLLGMRADEALTISGDLRPPSSVDHLVPPGAVERRPDIEMLSAELREANSEARLSRRARWPGVELRARYEREEGTPIVWGGVSVSLPFFERGQEARAAAEAREQRVRSELEAAGQRARIESQAGRAAYTRRRSAVHEYESSVLPSVEDNDMLVRRSFEVGQIGLADVLLARREGTEARAGYLDALLEAAVAEVELRARTGGLQ